MLMPGTIMRRAMKGQLDLMTPVMKLMGEVKADSIPKDVAAGPLGREATAIDILRRWATFAYGVPAQKAMGDPKFMTDNQILLEQIADVTMDMYAAESSYLRTMKMIASKGEDKCAIPILLTQIIVYERMRHAMELVRQICANTAGGDDAEYLRNRKAMERMAFDYPLDTMRMKDRVAEHLIERGQYALS